MKKFELIVGLIAIFGIFLQICQIPSSILTVPALMLLSTFYYVFSFALFNGIRLRDIFKKASYKDTNVKRIIGSIGLGFALSAIIIGGLSKLKFWAGANIYLHIGLVNTGFILLIAIIFYFRNKADYYKRIFKRIVIYGGLGLILYLTPIATLLDIEYADNPVYSEHPDFAEHYKKMLVEAYNRELHKQVEQMRIELQQMKIEEWLQERNNENQ